MDGKDGNGLTFEKTGQFFHTLMLRTYMSLCHASPQVSLCEALFD